MSEKKKILILGNSANAYSLAKKLSENNEIFAASGSNGMKEFAQCVDIRESSVNELLDFALENGIDMVIPVSQASQFSLPIAFLIALSSSAVMSRHLPGLSIPSFRGPMLIRRSLATSSPTVSHIFLI